MLSIIALISAVIVFFAIMLLLAAGVAFAYSDWQAVQAFLFLSASLGFLAILTMLATANRFKKLNRVGVFSASIFMWLTLVLISLVPFMIIEDLSFIHALFEAVSAVVTLGITYVERVDISSSMIFYRGILAWTGGLLTLLMAVYVLGRYQVGGTSNQQLRLILHTSQKGNPKIRRTFLEVFVPYFSLTLICAAALVIARINPVDAVNISLNIISTNGFMPLDTGATILNNSAGEIILIIFMILGATSLVWHRTLISKSWTQAKEQKESLIFIFAIALVSLLAVIATLFFATKNAPLSQTILNKIFDVVSVMTTTGIIHDTRAGIGLPIELMLAIAVVGGCSYSTSGGLKVFRISAMFRHSANEIKKLVYPHLVVANSVNENLLELESAKAIWSALFIAILTIMLATITFSLQGINLVSSLEMSVGAFSSTANLVTLALDLPIGESPSNATMLTLSILSLVARIELLVVLAIFSRIKW